MHGIQVLVRGAVGRGICLRKRSLVKVRRHTHRHRICHRIVDAALAVRERELFPECQERFPIILARSDGAVCADYRWRGKGFEKCFSETVRCRWACEAVGYEDWVIRYGGVELSECWEPTLREVVWVESADGGDETPFRNILGARLICALHIGDGVCVLQGGVISRSVP
ncbi:hypothetical protein RRF57_012113 [Xylaria bambusicola]|uniref:Uncharacterized protein n=1 Tax=Xylaria bambusicola TaxID=326684 RepID=A0AAN7V088_9PEZI